MHYSKYARLACLSGAVVLLAYLGYTRWDQPHNIPITTTATNIGNGTSDCFEYKTTPLFVHPTMQPLTPSPLSASSPSPCFISSIYEQHPLTYAISEESNYLDHSFRQGTYGAFRLNIGATLGQTVGVDAGYGNVGFFLAPSQCCFAGQPFVDLNAYWLDDHNRRAASGGLGYRWLDSNYRMWGANVYYDYREAYHGGFNQWGLGLESLGPCWDVRLNGYLPLSGTRKASHAHIYEAIDGLYSVRQHEFSYGGVDLEIGKSLWDCDSFSFYGALGPYFYHKNHYDNFFGGQIRGVLSWREWLTFEVRGTYDERYNARLQGMINLFVPLDCFMCWNRCKSKSDCIDWMLTQSTVRRPLIATDKGCCWTRLP